MGFSRVSYAVVVCAALVAVLTFWMMREAYDALDVVSLGPVVGSANASKAINQRYNAVKKDFELALGTSGWTVLRTGANVSIETLQGGEVGVYIRTTAYFQAQPETVYNAFHWNRFEETQKKIDPFFESAELLKEVDRGMLLIRKTTKTPVIYKKRQFFLAFLEKKQDHVASILESEGILLQRSGQPAVALRKDSIKKNTLVNALINVKFDGSIASTFPASRSVLSDSYVTAAQDFIAWFTESGEGGTKLIICSRFDLGRDIPEWVLLTTIAAIGVWTMRSLRAIVDRDSSVLGRSERRSFLSRLFRKKQ